MAVVIAPRGRPGVRGPVDSGRLRVGEECLKVDELAKAESGVDAERSVVRTGAMGGSEFSPVSDNRAYARPRCASDDYAKHQKTDWTIPRMRRTRQNTP